MYNLDSKFVIATLNTNLYLFSVEKGGEIYGGLMYIHKNKTSDSKQYNLHHMLN